MNIVVAIDSKRGIGKNGKLLCRIEEDMENFVAITWGGTVVMGHNTFNEIGHPLEGRLNIVFTKEKFETDQNIKQVTSIKEFEDVMRGESKKTCFIIGGEQLYKEFIDKVDVLFITRFDTDFEADKFFPEFENDFVLINNSDWKESKELGFYYRFEAWERSKEKNVAIDRPTKKLHRKSKK